MCCETTSIPGPLARRIIELIGPDSGPLTRKRIELIVLDSGPLTRKRIELVVLNYLIRGYGLVRGFYHVELAERQTFCRFGDEEEGTMKR